MLKNRHFLLASFAVLFLGLNAWGQNTGVPDRNIGVSDRINQETDRGPSLESLEAAAIKETARSNYYGAMRYYKLILDVEPLNVTALNGFGESAILFSALDSAAMAFQRLIDNKLTEPDGSAYLRLAEVKYRQGKYQDAIDVYNRFLSTEKPSAPTESMIQEAEDRIVDCDWALRILSKPVVQAEVFAVLDTNVNTWKHSEHSPYLQGDTLYFSSSRYILENDRIYPKRDQTKVLTVKGKGLDFSKDLQLAPFNAEKRQTSHTSFSANGDRMFYTECDYIGNTLNLRCDIYLRRKLPDNTWGPAQKLPESVNMPGFNNTQPCVGPVPGEKYEMLYFVSDRPGGKGQKDIWCSKVIDTTYSMAMNVTTLNTPGNDVTPYYDALNKTFYYSTDSLQTLGGLDVFQSKWNGENWGEPVNMGWPINSPANDAYYVLTEEGKSAIMASNRRGSYNQSEEGCCYDLFVVDLYKPTMVAITHLKKERKPSDPLLPYTTMTLYEVGNPAAAPLRVDVGASAKHYFDLVPDRAYMIVAEKDRYTSDTVRFRTPTRKLWRKEIEEHLYLEPAKRVLNIKAYTVDASYGDTLYDVSYRFFEMPREKLLDTFVNLNNQKYYEPNGDFEMNYRMTASKAKYSKDTVDFTTMDLPMLDSQTVWVRLELSRGLESYLPIPLYFDNDEPDKRTLATTSSKPYVTANFEYFARHNTFITEYTKGLSPEAAQKATAELDSFFINEVRGGMNELRTFSEALLGMLQNGETIEITLQGFASPLAKPEYNKNLTDRRADSVYKHFTLFPGLQKYVDSKQLILNRVGNGEVPKVDGLSDDPKDKRKSIYDVRASRTRRLDVIGVSKITKEINR